MTRYEQIKNKSFEEMAIWLMIRSGGACLTECAECSRYQNDFEYGF